MGYAKKLQEIAVFSHILLSSWRENKMRIILDTDKKTVTVPWNYMAKLEEMNRIIVEATGDESKKKTFSGYLKECWDEAMKDTDKNLNTAAKPAHKK